MRKILKQWYLTRRVNAMGEILPAVAWQTIAEPEPDTASSEPATDGGFGTGTGADADYLTRFERRWDRLWSLACRVANAVRRCDEAKEQADVQWWEQELRDACRKLQRAVDEICPD